MLHALAGNVPGSGPADGGGATGPHAHGAERRAALRVCVSDLAREAGLGPRAVAALRAIAGDARLDGDELRIACSRYSLREDNRRWCMAALHRLVAESKRAAGEEEDRGVAPAAALFSATGGGASNNPYLREFAAPGGHSSAFV